MCKWDTNNSCTSPAIHVCVRLHRKILGEIIGAQRQTSLVSCCVEEVVKEWFSLNSLYTRVRLKGDSTSEMETELDNCVCYNHLGLKRGSAGIGGVELDLYGIVNGGVFDL